MLLAIPSDAPGGLDAAVSSHFGHCAAFTLIRLEDGEVGDVEILANGGHEHGGCMTPVHLLKGHEVEALVASGIGGRPLAGFQSVGITVYRLEEAATVRDAVKSFTDGQCQEFASEHTCGGGGGECGGHDHHQDIQRPALDGPAVVEKDRVVGFSYVLTGEDGEKLDSSEQHGPLRYLHGHSNIVPGLENALQGLKPADKTEVTVAPEDGYGVHDPENIISVPREKIGDDAVVGQVIHARTQQGTVALRVQAIEGDSVTLDANHPLAGKTLHFAVEIVTVEAAAPEELEAGRVLA